MLEQPLSEQIPLPWQTRQWRHLWIQHNDNQLAHAYLMAGPSGLGKALFARQFARLMLCASPEQKHVCDSCRNCVLGKQGEHPDIFSVAPEEGARDIKIDQVRALAEFVVRTSHAGGPKIAIIDHAHQMNSNAANALLKTLEEPRPGTYLFLTSDSPGSLAATIRSRCQRLQFHEPDLDAASDWLQQAIDDGADAVKLLAATNNRPLLALELSGNGTLTAREDFIEKLCLVLSGQQSAQTVANQAIKIGESTAIGCLLETSSILSKYLLRQDLSQQMGEVLANLAQGVAQSDVPAKTKLQYLAKYYETVLVAAQQLDSGSNPNPQLVFESLLWRWRNLPLGIQR